MTAIEMQGAAAKQAAKTLMTSRTDLKDKALLNIARLLEAKKQLVLDANALDMENARKSGMTEALMDRLALDSARIDGIAAGVREVAALPDPIGQTDRLKRRHRRILYQ